MRVRYRSGSAACNCSHSPAESPSEKAWVEEMSTAMVCGSRSSITRRSRSHCAVPTSSAGQGLGGGRSRRREWRASCGLQRSEGSEYGVNLHQPPPTSTNLHQPPPTSTNLHQPPPTSTNLHQPPPTSTNLHGRSVDPAA